MSVRMTHVCQKRHVCKNNLFCHFTPHINCFTSALIIFCVLSGTHYLPLFFWYTPSPTFFLVHTMSYFLLYKLTGKLAGTSTGGVSKVISGFTSHSPKSNGDCLLIFLLHKSKEDCRLITLLL